MYWFQTDSRGRVARNSVLESATRPHLDNNIATCAESVAAFDLARDRTDVLGGIDHLVFESLVVSLLVVMREAFVNGGS